MIAAALYKNQGQNKKFFPILFAEENVKHIPLILTLTNHYLLDKDFSKLKGLLTRTPEASPDNFEQDRKSINFFNLPISSESFYYR